MSKYAEIRNDFEDNGIVRIDAWTTADDNEEGKVIAYVVNGEALYVDDNAQFDDYAQEVINEVIEEQKTSEVKPTELSKQEADDKMELVYLETPSGMHIGLDATYIDQVGDFEIILPTGEKINTKNLVE
jgi:hypothetical protein